MCVLLRLKFQPSQAVTLRCTVVGIFHAVCSNSYLQLFGYLGGGVWAQECQPIPRGTFSLLEASDLSAARLGAWGLEQDSLQGTAWVQHMGQTLRKIYRKTWNRFFFSLGFMAVISSHCIVGFGLTTVDIVIDLDI